MNNIKLKEKNNINIKTEKLFKEEIIETDKLLKYTINIIILLGSLGFFIVGISSYIKINLIFFLQADQIIFFPQGLTMCFYGFCGTIISINQIKILLINAGEGYNEFNKETNTMQIYRKGLNGKKSDINIIYSIKDILRNNTYKDNNLYKIKKAEL